jgi:hypothetical protein
MKTQILTLFLSTLLCTCTFAQDADVEENSASDAVDLRLDNVPVTIKQAVLRDFTRGDSIQWAKFPYFFKDFGWLVNYEKNEVGEKPDQVYVQLKTKNGNELDAVYTSDGKLIRSTEYMKEVPLPRVIVDSIISKYKGWSISDDKELVTDYSGKILKHYTIKIVKDKKKKYIHFDEKGNTLINKKK